MEWRSSSVPTCRGLFPGAEGPGRRNHTQAERSGYTFSRIDFNQRARKSSQIIALHRSDKGPMARRLMTAIAPISDPPSRNPGTTTCTPGSARKGGTGPMWVHRCGRAVARPTFTGITRTKPDGIVPLMFMESKVRENSHPQARYSVAKFWGQPSVRRFKRKFGFLPNRVQWRLD